MANNATNFNYYIQGVEGVTGAVTITASASDFTDGSGTANIVQAALKINGLNTAKSVGAADDPFFVDVGVSNVNSTDLAELQAVRAGGSTLTAVVTNSAAVVGQLITTSQSAQSVSVSITPGNFRSPTTVASGGVAFDTLAAGSTNVEATITGLISTNAASKVVVVSP